MTLITFFFMASLLVISPGPNGLLIAKTVPTAGRKAGFANIWGFVAAFYVHGTLSIFGISVLLVQSPQAFVIFKLLGAGYLCWIGLKALFSAWKNGKSATVHASNKNAKTTATRNAFLEGFLTNVLNPKVSIFYLAVFPQFMSTETSISQAYLLVSTHAFISLMWFSSMVLLLHRLKGIASSAGFTKWLKSITGVVFIGFGTKLLLLKP